MWWTSPVSPLALLIIFFLVFGIFENDHKCVQYVHSKSVFKSINYTHISDCIKYGYYTNTSMKNEGKLVILHANVFKNQTEALRWKSMISPLQGLFYNEFLVEYKNKRDMFVATKKVFTGNDTKNCVNVQTFSIKYVLKNAKHNFCKKFQIGNIYIYSIFLFLKRGQCVCFPNTPWNNCIPLSELYETCEICDGLRKFFR